MELFYRHYGSGPPIIILHGLYGISDNWVSIGRRLAENFSVFIPDQRNHGQSPHSTVLNYPAMAEDILEFIKQHDLQNPVLLGHSMGGKVAMQLALDNPAEIAKLIVVDISMRAYDLMNIHVDVLKAMMSIDFSNISTRLEVEHLLALAIPDRRLQLFIMKNLYRKTKTTFGWRLNLETINNNLEDISAAVNSPGIFPKPALFIKGELSDYLDIEDFSEIKRHFPESEMAVIPGAGHWVHADAPKEMCRILSRFLGKECEADSI